MGKTWGLEKLRIIKVKEEAESEVIQKAVALLKGGGLLIYPTETCYGVGVEATNKKAVNKLLKYKRRPEGKAISIAVSSPKMAQKYVYLNETAKNLYKNFLPGPLTVISKSRGKVVPSLEAKEETLGVRLPNYPLVLKIIEKLGQPITATSANASGKRTPYSIPDILENLGKKQKQLIDLVLDAGRLPQNPPSTVVDTTLNELQILRKGELQVETFAQKGQIKKFISTSEEGTKKIAQKLMKSLLPKLKDFCIIFALQGELGVGKTCFAQGLAKGLGIKEKVTSPTFVLLREYKFKRKTQDLKLPKLFHFDTWRMYKEEELLDLGFYNMLKKGNVIVIEWLQKVRKILEEAAKRKEVEVVWVLMEYKNRDQREIFLARR